MTLLIVSFLAGVLTVLAPCVLPLLPVVLGGSLADPSKKPSPYRPVVIAFSLSISIIVFTLMLKATTALISIPDLFWQIVSGVLLIAMGSYFLYPTLWYRSRIVNKASQASNVLLGKTLKNNKHSSAIITGVALGPVFNSCSPTYTLILASVLPNSFTQALLYLIAYSIGLCGTLLVIAYAGKSIIGKLSISSKKLAAVFGSVFIIVGIAIILGLDKQLQIFILDQGWYDPIGRFEQSLNK